MVDFSDALKARIAGMSPDDLAATVVRRLNREADAPKTCALDATWDSPAGKAPVTKELAVKIDPGTAPLFQDILRFSESSSFHESIILTAATYRTLAIDLDDGARTGTSPRFVLQEGGAGTDRVSVDGAQLAALIARERPAPMNRARRLVAAELRSLTTQRLSVEQRIALFEEEWNAEEARHHIDAAIATVSSRGLLIMSGQDRVALWIRKTDFGGAETLIESPLMAAVIQPPPRPTRPSVFATAVGASNDQDALYLQYTSGTGPERTLVLDVGKMRNSLPALPKVQRDAALALLIGLIERSESIADQRSAKTARV